MVICLVTGGESNASRCAVGGLDCSDNGGEARAGWGGSSSKVEHMLEMQKIPDSIPAISLVKGPEVEGDETASVSSQ